MPGELAALRACPAMASRRRRRASPRLATRRRVAERQAQAVLEPPECGLPRALVALLTGPLPGRPRSLTGMSSDAAVPPASLPGNGRSREGGTPMQATRRGLLAATTLGGLAPGARAQARPKIRIGVLND